MGLQHLKIILGIDCAIEEKRLDKELCRKADPNTNLFWMQWLCKEFFWFFSTPDATVISADTTIKMKISLISPKKCSEEDLHVPKSIGRIPPAERSRLVSNHGGVEFCKA